MATNTPNLNLLKKDPVTDGNETFNIQTMLNDNWDKIDAAVGEIDIPDASLTVKGKVQLSNETDSDAEDRAATSRAVKAVSDNFAAQLADVAQEAQAAKTLGDERKQQVVDALIAWGVSASMADSWDTLFLKMTTVIKATGNATAADVLAGKTFSNANGNGLLGAMPHLTGTRNAAGVAQWPDGALAVYPEKGYQKGGVGDGEIKVSVAQLQQAELDLVAGNILNGKVIFGITGTLKDASNIVVVEHAPSVTQSDAEYNRVIDFPAGYTPIAWSGAAVYLQYPSGVTSQYYTSYAMKSAKNLTPDVSCYGTNRSVFVTGTISWTGSIYRATYRVRGSLSSGGVDLNSGSFIGKIYWVCSV